MASTWMGPDQIKINFELKNSTFFDNLFLWRNKKNINTFGLKKKHLINSFAKTVRNLVHCRAGSRVSRSRVDLDSFRQNLHNFKFLQIISPPFRVGRHIVFPPGICLSVTLVSALLLENHSSYLHKTSCKYLLTLDNVQSTRTITLAFILFELFPLDSHKILSPL